MALHIFGAIAIEVNKLQNLSTTAIIIVASYVHSYYSHHSTPIIADSVLYVPIMTHVKQF